MKESEVLFNNVFEEVLVDSVPEIEGGALPDWYCPWLAYSCAHGLIIGGCGGFPEPDFSACELHTKYCK